MNATLKINTVVKTDRGEWVQVVDQNENMVTVDSIGKYEHRTQIHINHLLLNTAHELSKKL